MCLDFLCFSDVLISCPQKEPLQVSSSLQDGRQSVRLHCHRVRHEGVWLVAREGLQLCQAKEEHHSTEPRFHETAGRVRGHPGCQVQPRVCVHSVVLQLYYLTGPVFFDICIFYLYISSKQRHNKLWHPDADCEMAEGQHTLSQCCGGEEGGHLTPEPGMSPCCEEALSDKGAACPSPCRTVSLDIDPAYNNYYFRRLSDSALDSEPSTPVRGPPLIGMEKVFIEIEDVERDALLDDEALPLSHFGPSAEGTAAQTSSRGPEPLEELRLRLEFSTVEEEDEEEVQKEEAEMEVLMQPDDGGGGEGGGGEETQDVDTEGNGMDLATLNENSNNNNRLSTPRNLNASLSFMIHPHFKERMLLLIS